MIVVKAQEHAVSNLCRAEESFWRQICCNFAFFHKLIKAKWFKEQIKLLYNADGHLLTSHEAISYEAVAFFQRLLGSIDPACGGCNLADHQSFVSFQPS